MVSQALGLGVIAAETPGESGAGLTTLLLQQNKPRTAAGSCSSISTREIGSRDDSGDRTGQCFCVAAADRMPPR